MVTKPKEIKKVIDFAISEKEYKEFGCPVCGYAYSTWHFMGGGGLVVTCRNKLCDATFYVLHNGNNKFDGISFGRRNNKDGWAYNIKPALESHPRKVILAWGKREDKSPAKKGEFFTNPHESDYKHGLCFICKACCRLPIDAEWPMKPLYSISTETTCEKAAKRIQSIFKKVGLFTNLVSSGKEYPFEFYFVNISSCYDHRPNLLRLRDVAEKRGMITENKLKEIKALK